MTKDVTKDFNVSVKIYTPDGSVLDYSRCRIDAQEKDYLAFTYFNSAKRKSFSLCTKLLYLISYGK